MRVLLDAVNIFGECPRLSGHLVSDQDPPFMRGSCYKVLVTVWPGEVGPRYKWVTKARNQILMVLPLLSEAITNPS